MGIPTRPESATSLHDQVTRTPEEKGGGLSHLFPASTKFPACARVITDGLVFACNSLPPQSFPPAKHLVFGQANFISRGWWHSVAVTSCTRPRAHRGMCALSAKKKLCISPAWQPDSPLPFPCHIVRAGAPIPSLPGGLRVTFSSPRKQLDREIFYEMPEGRWT